MRKPTLYCTMDTETLGGATHPEGVYNVGGIIHDKRGNVYATFNLLVREYFQDILDRAFYGKKNFSLYQSMMENGSITMINTEAEAVQLVDTLLTAYNVKYVMAFNTSFDFARTAFSSLIENREFIDIYEMAYTIYRPRPSYKKYCDTNGFITRAGKPQCKVETIYGFITNNPDFEEEHTAFSDAHQEMEIFVKLAAAHKKYSKNCHCGARFGWI